MTIALDHTIVPSRSKVASAKLLADLLGVPWAPTSLGPFAPVFVNDGLTLDFIDTDEDFPVYHFCFRVSRGGVRCDPRPDQGRGDRLPEPVHQPVDYRIDTQFGGSGVYWNEPDGHQWEMLTVSYARQTAPK